VLAGRTVEVPVRVSARSRRLRLVVDPSRRPEIVVPPGTSAGAIDRLLVRHGEWLARQLARPVAPFRLGLQRDDVVWVRGVSQPLPRVARLGEWYREQARREARSAADALTARLGLAYRALAIRDQRTRWGSCSSAGRLSVNWRLVLAPGEILDYVVAHEVCHLIRHDHSAAFWREVAAARPTFQAERRWLAEHGRELLAYRVPGAAERPRAR
jgi:predicted metal-dependent hydrolase